MKYSIIIISLLFLSSCVPYKNIVYVQGDINNSMNEKSYKVKPKDILYINIKSPNEIIEKSFSQNRKIGNGQVSGQQLYFEGYTVDDQGNIEMPVIGKIKVSGLTFEEIKKLIRKRLLQTQLKSLDETFIVVKLAGIPFTILGEVKNPHNGILYKTNANIFDAIADAGDINITGNRKKVVLIRQENGKQTKTNLNLTDASIVKSQFFYLRPNDLIYVEPLKQKTLGTGTTLSQTISTTITALSLITSLIIFSNYINNK